MQNAATATPDAEPEVLFQHPAEARGGVLRITLNRPKALNALTLDMIRAIDPVVAAAANDPAIRCVLIEGAGERAFCAGGDVRKVAESIRSGPSPLSQAFFREEYVLNHRIATFPKPWIALIDGVSMGGGVGLSVHGSHRVVTERLTFAMPETGIGLFPDVGGGWFLAHCPGQTGLFCGLTGARIKAADALYIGYATQFVPSDQRASLRTAILAEAPGTAAEADAVIARFAGDAGPPPMATMRDSIDRCFAHGSVEQILAALDAEGSAWAGETAALLRTKSPTSVKVTFEQIARSRGLSIADALALDYRLSQHFMANSDFGEGIRALLIDKDNKPAWRPARLEDVPAAKVAEYFESIGSNELVF